MVCCFYWDDLCIWPRSAAHLPEGDNAIKPAYPPFFFGQTQHCPIPYYSSDIFILTNSWQYVIDISCSNYRNHYQDSSGFQNTILLLEWKVQDLISLKYRDNVPICIGTNSRYFVHEGSQMYNNFNAIKNRPEKLRTNSVSFFTRNF